MSVPPTTLPIDTTFDVTLADRLARFETYNKHHYRPNTYLHKWWGRRCGSTFRLILKGLVDDPACAGYYTPRGLEGKVILDPMMGGGTTLHEAIRLGAGVMGMDIDPIPVLQARATLTERDVAALEVAFARFHDGLSRALAHHFTTHCPTCDEPAPFWYALHGLRQRCGCGEVLVVDSLIIRQHADGRTLRLCPRCGDLYLDSHHTCPEARRRIIEKGQPACPDCGEAYRERDDRPFHARYELIALAGHCPEHGLFHRPPDWRDEERQRAAEACRASLPFAAEQFCVIGGDKSIQLLRRGVSSYLDLFSGRQLLFLSETLRQLPDDDPIVRLNLALLVSTSLEFNSMLCGYKGVASRRAGAVRHTFSHHGYSFPYTALEANPLYPRRASGTLHKLFQARIGRGRRWAAAPLERDPDSPAARFVPIAGERDGGREVASAAELKDEGGGIKDVGGRMKDEAAATSGQRFFLRQGSAAAIPAATGSVDAIVTDPPYYDSIQYGDLAAFFRVWLRQFLPDAADWGYDERGAAENPERGDEGRYVQMMSAIFGECRRVLRPDGGRLIFTFHHWQPRAWAALTVALRAAGFRLLNRTVVHAEHLMSVHINNSRALTHDAILVLAPAGGPAWTRPSALRGDSRGFTEDCATLLGWMLNGEAAADEIEGLWGAALASIRATPAAPALEEFEE